MSNLTPFEYSIKLPFKDGVLIVIAIASESFLTKGVSMKCCVSLKKYSYFSSVGKIIYFHLLINYFSRPHADKEIIAKKYCQKEELPMSFIKYEYIRINKFSRPGIKNYGIKGIIMHYTANNGGTARNHKDYFNNLNGVYASAHLFVDDNEAICIIPLDEVAYHANDTVRYNSDGSIYKPLYSQIGNANYGAIGVEMCLDRNGNITEKTFQNTVKAVKELIAKYPNITRNKIWRHYDVTGKNCPAPWVAKPSELERFKDAVFGKTSGSNSAAKPSTPSAKPSTNKIPEDGMFGPSTANKAMKYEGITPDDEISHQYRQACNKNLYAAQFDNTLKGSTLIRTWQKRLKAKGLYNGAIDGLCGTEMIKAMQRALKTTVDGVISPVSNMVKALQVALNNNKLPW